MQTLGPFRERVSTTSIALAGVLLLGVVLLAFGSYAGSTRSFLIGLFVTILGVLSGVLRIVVHRKH
jgi:drug/metabolite transporter (DMT)-like permease